MLKILSKFLDGTTCGRCKSPLDQDGGCPVCGMTGGWDEFKFR